MLKHLSLSSIPVVSSLRKNHFHTGAIGNTRLNRNAPNLRVAALATGRTYQSNIDITTYQPNGLKGSEEHYDYSGPIYNAAAGSTFAPVGSMSYTCTVTIYRQDGSVDPDASYDLSGSRADAVHVDQQLSQVAVFSPISRCPTEPQNSVLATRTADNVYFRLVPTHSDLQMRDYQYS